MHTNHMKTARCSYFSNPVLLAAGLILTLLITGDDGAALQVAASGGAERIRYQMALAAQAPVQEYKAPPGVDQQQVIARHNQGNQFLLLKMWDEAEAEFRAAIELDRGNPYSYNGLALAQYGRGEYDNAMESCLLALELWPDYAYVRCTLGLALQASGNTAAAVDVLEEAMQLSQPGEQAYTMANALLTRFRKQMEENPGSGLFSMQAADGSVQQFLDSCETFEDILVSSPFTPGSVAPGAGSQMFDSLRRGQVDRVVADTDELIAATSGYAALLDGLEEVVAGAASSLAGESADGSALATLVTAGIEAARTEQGVAREFIARLDTSAKDEFTSSSLQYQRTLMAMRLACLQLQQTEQLLVQSALLIAESQRSMPAGAAALEQQLLEGLGVLDREAVRRARLDHALHYVDNGLRTLDTADYYYGLEALAFMRTEMANVRFRAMNLRTSDRIDTETAKRALGTIEYLAQLEAELQEQFDRMDTSRLLTDEELSAGAGQEPGVGLRIALLLLGAEPANADDKVYSERVQRALQRDRRLFERSTSEYEGIPHAVGGMVRATQDLAGSTVDMFDALVSTAVIPVAGAWHGDSGQEIWNEIKGKYRAVGENYRNGTSGTRVFRTATEYMEAAEGMAEQAASGTVRVITDTALGGGEMAPWVAGKLAKTGVGMFTALGKGVNKVLDPTSTPGEVSHGVLHIGLTVTTAGTGGLTAPVGGVTNAVRTASGMGANGGMRELTGALAQGYLTDSGKELLEWGEDRVTGFDPRPNPFLPEGMQGGPQVNTAQDPPAGTDGNRAAGSSQPAGSDASGNGGNPAGQPGAGAGSGAEAGGGAGNPAGGSDTAGGRAPGTDSGGGSGEGLPSEDTVPDNGRPSCTLSASQLAGAAPLTVQFSLSGKDADGNPLSSFQLSGGGIPAGQVGSGYSHVFRSPGEFRITARSVDDAGNMSDPAELIIKVFGPPKAVLGSVPAGGYAPFQLNLDFSGSTASGEGVKRYVFSDGKGGTHESSSVSVSYDAPGGRQQYNISLVVYDEAGNASEPATASFEVYQEPVAAIRLGTELGQAPLEVAVDGTASQCFNGSQFSRARIYDNIGNAADNTLSTSFRYEQPGTYTITLEVTDAGGKKSSVQASVEVTEALLAGLLVGSFSEPAPGRLELTLDPENRSFSGYVSGVVNWSWGDMSGSVPYSGTLSGSYDPQTGVLKGSLTGVCNEKAYNGSISGVVRDGAASGKWNAANEDGSYEGSWQAGGG